MTARGRQTATVKRRASLLVALLLRPWDAWLALRMAAWRLVLPVMKRRRPLPQLVALMWDGGVSQPAGAERERRIAELASVVFRSRHQERFGNCLDRSLVLYRYLSGAGADPELLVGVRREDGAVLGHAWVTVRGDAVEESPEILDGYSRVVAFRGEGAATPPDFAPGALQGLQ